MGCKGIGVVLGAVLMALLPLTGCAPSAATYYSGLHRRRIGSYERWERQSKDELDHPVIEGPLELEGAIRLALQYNTQLRGALREKERARARTIKAYGEALPDVDLEATYRRLNRAFVVDLGVESFQIGDEDNYSYRVQVTQPIYQGGRVPIALRAARLFSYLSDETVRQSVEGVVFEVAKGYFDVVLAQRMVGVQEAALEAAQAHLANVESRFRHGLATEYDTLRARVDVSNTRADLVAQRNQRDIAITTLLKTMGVSQRSEVKLTTDMQYREMDPDFSNAVRVAFVNRPDIFVAELSRDLQAEALKEGYTKYWPRLSAYFWHLWAKPDPEETSKIRWNTDWEAGLLLTWSLFDGLEREGNIMEQRALLRQREILLADAEQQTVREIKSAILELRNARELVESQQLNLQQADRALELVQAGYKEDVNTAVEVLDARSALTRARGLYYQALHRHTVGRLNLQRAMGMTGLAPRAKELENLPGSLKALGLYKDFDAGDGRARVEQ